MRLGRVECCTQYILGRLHTKKGHEYISCFDALFSHRHNFIWLRGDGDGDGDGDAFAFGSAAATAKSNKLSR